MAERKSNKKSNLENLRKMAKMTGVDIDAAFEEIKGEIVERIKPLLSTTQVDTTAITKQVVNEALPLLMEQARKAAEDTETRLALKLGEALEEMQKMVTQVQGKSAGVDSNAIIQGVIQVLQPEIVKASQSAAEAVFEANSKTLIEQFNNQVNERMAEMQESSQQQPAAPAGGGFNLLSNILGNEEIMSKLMDKILGIQQPAPQNAMMADFSRFMNFHDLMTKIEKRQASSEDIASGLAKIASPNQEIPKAQNTQTEKE